MSLCILIALPFIQKGVSAFARDETLATTFALALTGFLLVIYDWELIGVHYNRAKKKPAKTVAWMVVGLPVIGLWLFVATSFLNASPLLPGRESLQNSLSIAIAAIPAYTFVQACVVNISFKCLTDHISVHQREELVILLSGFLFGTLYSVLFLPMSLEVFLPTLLYNILLVSILSYLYNQSGNLVAGTLALSLCYFVYCGMLLL